MGQLQLRAEVMTLQTRHPFVIARGGHDQIRTVQVTLQDSDGVEGWGEAAPQAYYGETPETVLAALTTYATALPDDPFDLEHAERVLVETLDGNASARAALSAALHDLVGKRLGVPLWKLWGLAPMEAPLSTFTIGIDTVDRIRLKVQEASAYPILKVKVGTDRDHEILSTIRQETDREIRVDANCGWSRKAALQMLPVLAEFGVTVLEQPLHPDDLEGLSDVTANSPIPVLVDESCMTTRDIPQLAGRADGINIKLAKCGSLREARRMISVARAHHLQVMIGCMIESSIGITAAAHLTPLVDFVDLDGAALLANDPFVGATIKAGQIRLPEGPGLGVHPR